MSEFSAVKKTLHLESSWKFFNIDRSSLHLALHICLKIKAILKIDISK